MTEERHHKLVIRSDHAAAWEPITIKLGDLELKGVVSLELRIAAGELHRVKLEIEPDAVDAALEAFPELEVRHTIASLRKEDTDGEAQEEVQEGDREEGPRARSQDQEVEAVPGQS